MFRYLLHHIRSRYLVHDHNNLNRNNNKNKKNKENENNTKWTKLNTWYCAISLLLKLLFLKWMMFAYRTVLPQKSMNHFSIIVYLRDPKPFLSLCDFWRVSKCLCQLRSVCRFTTPISYLVASTAHLCTHLDFVLCIVYRWLSLWLFTYLEYVALSFFLGANVVRERTRERRREPRKHISAWESNHHIWDLTLCVINQMISVSSDTFHSNFVATK